MQEIWLPVVGYEGFYEVSTLGRVRSIDHFDALGRFRPGRVRGTPVDKTSSGYRYVSLSRYGQVKKVNVHVLVLEAFAGARPTPSHQACHEDGDRSNAVLSNLRWDTVAANSADRWKHGTESAGEKSPFAILIEEEVLWIRESQQSSLKLAPILGVASSTIRAIRLRTNWSHI